MYWHRNRCNDRGEDRHRADRSRESADDPKTIQRCALLRWPLPEIAGGLDCWHSRGNASFLLVGLRRILDNPEAMAAVERIEGWRALGDNIIETIINKSEKVKELKNRAKERDLTEKEKKELTAEEKEYKSKRKLVQEKLIKFATRIPAFMYLTDFRENTLQDVITKLEPDLFLTVTGLAVKDFHLLVSLKVFNTEQMNQAVFAFRRYEDASLRYTGIESHEGLTHYGLYDTVVEVPQWKSSEWSKRTGLSDFGEQPEA